MATFKFQNFQVSWLSVSWGPRGCANVGDIKCSSVYNPICQPYICILGTGIGRYYKITLQIKQNTNTIKDTNCN